MWNGLRSSSFSYLICDLPGHCYWCYWVPIHGPKSTKVLVLGGWSSHQEIYIRSLQAKSRSTRYQSTAQGMVAAPWSMRVFLHCPLLWRQCQLLVQLSNVSDSKQTKTNPSPLNRETGKNFKKLETSLDESNFRCFKIWQLHNLCQPIATGRALAALAAWKFRMLSMPWQNDTGLQAGRRGKSWFWYLYFCGSLTVFESLAFRVNCNICSLKNGR